MESTAMEPTASISDCQFCRVRFQQSGCSREGPQDPGACRLPSCCSLYAATPATDWTSHDSRKIRPMTRPRELEYRPSRQPRALAQDGESSCACSPTY